MTQPKNTHELVAVIGLGCVMPDANNVAEFWQNLQSGKNSVREVPKERWDPAVFYDANPNAPDKTYAKIGAFVTSFKFNSLQFKIPPSVAKQLDETQKWALSAVAEAFVDAGYDKKPFDRKRCAVILGNAMGGEIRNDTGLRVLVPKIINSLRESAGFKTLTSTEQERILRETEFAAKQGLPEITEDTMPGELSNVIAGRIANVFDLAGKNFTTDAACASSLAAIDAAVKGLQAGDYDLVLTGGADRSMDIATYVKFCKIGALSANGSFPFDARADGFVMGEGCGIILLKRLDDAIRDGDKIRAVIRGVGSSSDAKGKGITAPNIDGQLSCLTRGLEDARVAPETVTLLECHGTSTKVGDVVEIQALTKIFGPKVAKKQSVAIGSVKSQVGHLKSAAGAASLLKIILAAENKILPPSINFQTPNPNIDWANTPFYVNSRAKPWPDPPAGTPRRCSISSFGFGGTNFSVVIEEYAPATYPEAAAATANAAAKATPVSDVLLKREPRHRTLEPLVATARTDLLVVGAATVHDLEGRVREIKDQLAAGTVTQETFSSYAAQVSRQGVGKPVRLALVVENLNELPPRLDLGLEAVKEPKKRIMVAPKGIYVGEGAHRGKMAMLFPGQGSQYADMLRDLSTRFETVKRTLEQIDAVMTPFLGKPITEFIFLDPAKGVTREAAEEALKQTAVTQPAMLTADLALYRLLGDYGVKPDMVAGHSLGEYGALVASGVMTLEDACIAVSARGREMANVHVPDLGKMASVTADPATVEKLLKNVEGYVIPANKNCKVQTVIAGSSKSVEAAVAMFNQAGIQAQHIAVSAAFHSQIVAPAIVPLQRVFERLDIREPKIALLSNVTADYYPTGPGAREKIIDLLSRQVAAAVEWQKQTERMYHDGARLFVEVGPKTVLTTFTKNTLEGKEFVAVGTNHPKRGGFYHFFDALAILAAWGYQLKIPDPTTADVSLPAFREATQAFQPAAPPGAAVVPAMSDARAKLIQQLTTQMRQLQAQVEALASGEGAGDGALQRRIEQLGLNLDKIVVSGVSVGLPGMHKRLFDDDNFDRILRGENLIDKIDEAHQRRMLDKNIVRLVKSEKGDHRFEAIKDVADVVRLAGRMGGFDFVQDYGIGADFADALDVTSELAIAAGIEALRDAGIPLVRSLVKTSTGKFLPGDWVLPEPLQQETGIIFASAFPGYNRLIEAVSNYFAAKHGGKGLDELADIYAELIQTVRDPEVRRRVTDWYTRNFQAEHRAGGKKGAYEFNRKFLFHVLSLGHAQLAQLIKAKGPNTQLNAACSSTTQAVGVAEDWIRTGRCKRVLVVGADDITSDTSLEWFSSGFLAAGAASTKDRVEDAALPFDRRRHGMIIGMGAVGLVVEGDKEVRSRGMEPIVEIVASHIANSAYHGSRLDTEHVATEMDRLLAIAEKRLGVPRSQLAPQMLFMSHETYTPARGGSAAAEIEALRKTFGPDANKVVVSNTKGFTGHSMGASIEDAIAVKSLQRGRVPPIANLKEPDPALGDLNLSHGGEYNLQYALRLAAGFGSQIAFLLFKLRSKDDRRIVDPATYQAWLTRMSGNPRPELEVASRALRIKSTITQALAVAKPDAPPAPTPRPASKPPTPKPAPVPVPAAPRPQPVGPVPAMAEIQGRIVDLIAEKTGYPKEMLDPNLDLEADLGIDTVKQAELFGFVRDTYSLAREDNLQLKDYPTIAKIAHYIQSRVGRATTIAAVTSAAVVHAPAAVTAVPAVVIATPVAAITPEAVFARLIDLVAEKTGYPKEMLDPNLDLEADLGIDTVKQAEVFGLLREHYQLPRDDSLQLKDYPTLTKIADYIASRASGTLPQRATPTPPSVPSTPSTTTPTTAAAPSRPSPASVSLDSLQRRVVDVIAEKTGYPKEMLDPNLDLEADLGIDTVKQAELFGLIRETYQLARDDSLQLKDYPTIAKIAGYIHSRLNGAAATAAPSTVPLPAPASPLPVSSPARPSPASAPAIGASTKDRAAVVARIRALIAEKTGYPMDLLDENLDLEADLGIDTVKQAELFGFVREAYGIARVENLQLSNYSTIAKVADFAIENAGKPGTPASVETIVSPASKPGTTRATRRYVVHYAPLPERAAATHSVEGRTLLVWAAPNYRADLVHELGRRGATAVSLDSLPATWDEARSRVEDLRRSHPRIHGLMFVPQPSPGGTDFSDDGLHAVKALFWILKGILTTGKSGEFEFFATGTTMGGDFATRPLVAFNPLEGGLVGIAKALRREIPNAQCKAVDFPPRVAPKTLAGTLLDELLHRDEWVEVGTLGGRGTLKLAEEELSEEEPGLDLSAKDVLVVTGGGAGITSDVCLGLAQRWKPSFLLLGRTQLPNNVEELARKSPQELAQLKSKILEDLRARGERGTPVQVEREFGKVQKIVEVHQTLERLRGMGCAVAYRACDVTDAKAVQRAVDEGRRALGAVTGIIHAAGLEESKLIVDKTPESFNRVFDAKVLGARNLLAATREDPVRFLVNFSSIAGRVGNAGQADYSAANDVLAKIGLALRHEKGATFPSVTVDWSAWGEKGMATRGSIMTVLTAAGVTPIPLQAGVQALVDEIAHGMRDAEVLVGAELGALADPKLFALRSANGHGAPTNVDLNVAAPKPQAQSGGQTTLFLESPRGAQSPAILDGVVNEDERSIVTRMVLDPARDPYLRDHSVDGVPYLPGVFGIEAFAETASRLAPGLRFIGARNIEYQLPVKVLRNQPVEVTIHASVANTERDHTEVGCRLQSVFVNAKGERLGAPRIHFTGTLLFGKAVEAETDATPAGMGPPIEAKEIYRQFFHGPSFQVLDSFQSNAEHKESVGVYAWPQAPLFGRSTGAFLTNPMGRELAYQTAGGYDLFVLRALSLPKAVGRIRFHDVPRPGERIVAVARYRDTHDNVSHFDVKLLGDRGRVLEELEDFELVRIKNLEPPASATLYRARWGHDFPLPLPGARAVLVRQPELAQLHVTAEEALTAGERADQERYRNEKRAREFFAGRLAAKEAIALLTERPLKESRGIEIRRLETGEPAARGKGTENIVVSITHTGDVALAVAARKESLTTIGIDAERIEEKPAAFTDEAFAPEEQQLLKRLVEKGAPSGQTQVLCWAVKEAVLKALGKGFALDVQDVRIESIEVEGACQVKLEEPARKCLAELGARQVHVQTWVRDEHAYALCWTTP